MQGLYEQIENLKKAAEGLLSQATSLESAAKTIDIAPHAGMLDPWVVGLTVFALACFVGYYVVWKVTPALHSPLMAVTNAISSVIIVGAMLAAGPEGSSASFLGFMAVFLASVNIFGGFIVTQRMLDMFSKSKK